MTTNPSSSGFVTDQTTSYLTMAEPQWIKDLVAARREQRRTVFLLHFNTRDLVFDPKYPPSSPDDLVTVQEYLAQRLCRQRHFVLHYSLHSGVRALMGMYDDELREKKRSQDLLRQTATPEPFAPADSRKMWNSVARIAAKNPFPLNASYDGAADKDVSPEHWALPNNVLPLLSRVFTANFRVAIRQSKDANSLNELDNPPLAAALIIDYVHHLAPAPGSDLPGHEVANVVETLQNWSSNPDVWRGNHIVIALTPELAAVHPELVRTDSYVERIRLDRPGRDERAEFMKWLAAFEKYTILQEAGMVDELANRASGMNYRELGDFVATLASNAEHWTRALADRRADIIRRESGGLLEPKESQYGLEDVAGYRYITQEVERRLPRIRAGKADVAGILFNGPPGTGKSFYASALAKSGGVNMVVIRNLRGMYVGQSERNLEQIFEVARTLAPVVVFVDEIDQVFASRDRSMDTSGGVEQRLLGRLLEFMDDKDNLGKVIWIAASNRPDLIDPALLSRFKLRLPFLLPDRSTCIELLEHQLPHQAEFRWQPATWDEQVVRDLVGIYSGRELDTIVRQALWKAQDDDVLLSDHSAMAETRLVQRREQLDEHGLKMPEIPMTAVDNDDRVSFEVHGQYLMEALRDAEVGHDPQEYLVQSLQALNWAPFTSPALIEAVETALPPHIVDEIVIDGRLNKKAIGRLIEENRPYATGRSYR